MSKLKTISLLLCLITFVMGANGQSKNQIKELNIKSTSVVEYDFSSGKESKRKVSFEKFNSRGQVTEYIDYDKAGKQKERITYTYNEDGALIEEKYFDNSNKLIKYYTYTYQNHLRQTKEKYDAKKKLVWRKVYEYDI